MHNVISYHALADDSRRKLTGSNDGPLHFIAIGRLRNLGLKSLFRKIRALRADRITVAIENDNDRSLCGPLVLIAAVSGAPRIDIFWPDGVAESISRAKVFVYVMRFFRAQLSGRISLRKAQQKLKDLDAPFHLPRLRNAVDNAPILYLDANLSSGAAAGGSVGHIKGIIDGFINEGFAVNYAACKKLPPTLPGARWLRVSAPDFYGFPPEINCHIFNTKYEKYLERTVKENSYSFLYQRMSVHNFSGAWLKKKTGIPLVLEFNGSEVWVAANWSERLRLHDIALKAEIVSLQNADIVVTVSEALGDYVAAAGVPRERIVVYPNCFDPSIFDPDRFSKRENTELRQRLKINGDAVVATFIGTFGVWHGVDFLARAIRRLVIEDRDWVVAQKLHFLLIGDGLKMPEIKELLATEPFDKFVTLTGLVPQADAPAFLAASDVFLSPHLPNADGSAFFGSPTKLFEYMAMAKPIVAADLDQIGAVLKGIYLDETPASDGPLGELFAPANESAFIEAIKKVVTDPESSSGMAKRAREAALRSYTWERHVDAILQRMKMFRLIERR